MSLTNLTLAFTTLSDQTLLDLVLTSLVALARPDNVSDQFILRTYLTFMH